MEIEKEKRNAEGKKYKSAGFFLGVLIFTRRMPG
jgi:hypothetical protein